MNVHLNLGGLLGALLGGGGVFAICYALAGGNVEALKKAVRPSLFALVAGALAGNYLWDVIRRRRRRNLPPDARDENRPEPGE